MVVRWAQDLAAARGVTRWAADVPLSALEDATAELGRRCVLLDGNDVEDKHDFLRLCDMAFALPEWFGHNWDALEECLADLDEPAGVVVIGSDCALFAESEPDEYATALDVFNDTARTLGLDGTPFAVLLIGDDGEDVDLLDEDDLDLDEDAEEDLDLDEVYEPGAAPVDEAF
jgi:hypothetical protein